MRSGEMVLILVLVEHTLGGIQHIGIVAEAARLNPCFSGTYPRSDVLMEYVAAGEVLILVLVEHTLGELTRDGRRYPAICLNPCFSGTYPRRHTVRTLMSTHERLNPCFSGTYPRSQRLRQINARRQVLILVLVEHTLGVKSFYYE